eukprot:15364357-Ditylum_brightwellii.AAC.2
MYSTATIGSTPIDSGSRVSGYGVDPCFDLTRLSATTNRMECKIKVTNYKLGILGTTWHNTVQNELAR